MPDGTNSFSFCAAVSPGYPAGNHSPENKVEFLILNLLPFILS
jgi:hypothetical protein